MEAGQTNKTGLEDLDFSDLFSNKLPKTNILIIGDLILDKYVFGRAERLSPESPVPVLNIDRESYRLGGAANTAANLAGLGVKPYIAGLVGKDDDAATLRSMLSRIVKDQDGLIIDPNRPTILKTRFLANHQQLLRTDQELVAPISVQHTEKMLEYMYSLLHSLDLIILSDYAKGIFNKSFAAEIIKIAQKANVPVLVDPKGKDYSRYKGAQLITPNLRELTEALNIPAPQTDKEIISSAQSLAVQNDFEAVLVTRSQDGMSLVPNPKNNLNLDHSYHYKSKVIEVYDVSGAGDTVISTLGAFLASGISLPQGGQIANIAAGIVVQKIGTATIQAAELKAALTTNFNPLSSPIRQAICSSDNWAGAQQIVDHWKAQGLKVGFTNGCFDVIHAGHVAYLNETKQKCDKLVVGLNSDSSVHRLKGEGRPVNTQENRAAVLAGLQAVDLLVIFAETQEEKDKAINIIEYLTPDVYFKGGDYTEDQIPEAPSIRSYGGEVFICKPVEGLSSTITLEKLHKKAAS